jgi:hypothetical protein
MSYLSPSSSPGFYGFPQSSPTQTTSVQTSCPSPPQSKRSIRGITLDELCSHNLLIPTFGPEEETSCSFPSLKPHPTSGSLAQELNWETSRIRSESDECPTAVVTLDDDNFSVSSESSTESLVGTFLSMDCCDNKDDRKPSFQMPASGQSPPGFSLRPRLSHFNFEEEPTLYIPMES